MGYYSRRRRYGRSKSDRFGMYSEQQLASDDVSQLKRVHFDGVNDYLVWLENGRKQAHMQHRWRDGGTGNDEWAAAAGYRMLQKGDLERGERFAEMAQDFCDQIEVPGRVWRMNVAGAFPSVPALLAGRPDSMWHRAREYTSREPIRVWIGLTSSAGVTPADLEKRGAALCAFSIALNMTRPVLLTPYVNLGGAPGIGAIISFDMLKPMVLSEIAAAVATPSVTRGLGIAACYIAQPNCYGSWWRDYDNPERMREQLGCAPQDVYLGSIHMDDPLLKDPVGWIKNNLSHLFSERSDYANNDEESN